MIRLYRYRQTREVKDNNNRRGFKVHFKNKYPKNWAKIADMVKGEAAWKCVRCKHNHEPEAGYCLTVHHFDGDKANVQRWNLMALCQRCHLTVQAKADPRQPIFFDPSIWAMPYVAGVYEAKVCEPCYDYDLERWIKLYEIDQERRWPYWAAGSRCDLGTDWIEAIAGKESEIIAADARDELLGGAS